MADEYQIYTKHQPRSGDVIFDCGHIAKFAAPDVEIADNLHWSIISEGIEAKRPDGTKIKGTWILECERCFLLRKATGSEPKIRHDFIWLDSKPIVKVNPEFKSEV